MTCVTSSGTDTSNHPLHLKSEKFSCIIFNISGIVLIRYARSQQIGKSKNILESLWD